LACWPRAKSEVLPLRLGHIHRAIAAGEREVLLARRVVALALGVIILAFPRFFRQNFSVRLAGEREFGLDLEETPSGEGAFLRENGTASSGGFFGSSAWASFSGPIGRRGPHRLHDLLRGEPGPFRRAARAVQRGREGSRFLRARGPDRLYCLAEGGEGFVAAEACFCSRRRLATSFAVSNSRMVLVIQCLLDGGQIASIVVLEL
jgi:hypothetical protein